MKLRDLQEDNARSKSKILILDFGSKKISDLANSFRQLKIFCEIHPFTISLDEIKKFNPKGIIFSGSSTQYPVSVSPLPDKGIYDLNVPILGICYGLEVIVRQLGGYVTNDPDAVREIGIVKVNLKQSRLFAGLIDQADLWMHHKEQVITLPNRFRNTASTSMTPNAAIEDDKRRIYGIQFHPEAYSRDGIQIFKNFIKICNCEESSSFNFKDHFYTGTVQ